MVISGGNEEDEEQADKYSIHFSHYANKLEIYLRRNGISCHDADIIIEESSVFYFEKIRSSESKRFKLIGKHDPAQVFAESAARAIEIHIPEAKGTFGSFNEIARHIK